MQVRMAVCGTLVLAGLLLVPGCGRGSTPQTGAREAAQRYLEAYIKQDWPAAHAALDADTRTRVSAEAYAKAASQDRQRLGFEVKSGYVAACRETGDQAIAQVSIAGLAGAQPRDKNLTLMLRRGAEGWGVQPSSDAERRAAK